VCVTGFQYPLFTVTAVTGKLGFTLYATIQKYLEITVKYQFYTLTLLPRINPLNPNVRNEVIICYPYTLSIEVVMS